MESADVKYIEQQLKAQFEVQREIYMNEITRLHNNQDRLLQCLEDVIIFAKSHKDFVLGSVIEDCLNDLVLVKLINIHFPDIRKTSGKGGKNETI